MALIDELNLGGTDADETEARAAAGGLVPVGLHHAELTGYRDTVGKEKGTKGRELTFTILAGPARGLTVKDTLWDSDKDFATTRKLIFAHRLGMLTKHKDPATGKTRYVPVAGKSDLLYCLGAVVVLDVKHEPWEGEKDGKKTSGIQARLSGEGVLEVSDPRVAKASVQLGTPSGKYGNEGGAGSAGVTVPSGGGSPAPTAQAAKRAESFKDL